MKAYSANNSSSQVRLNQLCSECHRRIKQKTVCPSCGDLARDQIVKGYEFAKDQYVIIDTDEIQKLRKKDEDKSIRIDAFVAPEEIDPLYWSDTSYFLAPDGPAGQKPFGLLHRVMHDKQMYCIAKVVLFNKEQLVLVRPLGKVLCMTVLKLLNQVKAPASFDDEVSEPAISDAEIQLAEMLVAETTSKQFDLREYKDEYNEKLTMLIESKVNGEELVSAPEDAEPHNVINLMEALKASVTKAQEARGGSPIAQGGPKKAAAAPRKRAAKKTPAAEQLADQLAKPTKRKAAKKKSS